MMTLWLILFFIWAFFIGSIPTGFIAGKCKGIDITKVGSGSVGATNALRTLGRKTALAVFLIDAAKGWFATQYLDPFFSALAPTSTGLPIPHPTLHILFGATAVTGHVWNPFLRFHGGKGVATGVGVLLALDPLLAFIGLGVFAITLTISRFASLGSLIGTCSALIGSFVIGTEYPIRIFLGIILIFFIVTHRSNLKRLIEATEHKISFRKKQHTN